MEALDTINDRFGRGALKIAEQGEPDAAWHMHKGNKIEKLYNRLA